MTESQKKKLRQSYFTINELSQLSGQSRIELLMVFMDYKPAAAETVFFDSKFKKNLPQIQDYAKKLGLYFATSPYKYIVNSPRGIFTEIPLADPHLGKIIIAFSKSRAKAKKGAIYYHKKMLDSVYGYKFGKLMGYPECCLKFGGYLDNTVGDPNNFGFKNPAVESLKRSKHFDWHLNVFAVSLIPHFPCSLICKKSIEYVTKFFECLDYVDKKDSLMLKDYLTKPAALYWTCADRILLYGNFKKYTLGTGEINYYKIESMITSDTYYQEVDKKKIAQWRNIEKFLRQGNKLIVTDNLCTIYQGKKKIFEIKKTNKYIPVLVKPDILP